MGIKKAEDLLDDEFKQSYFRQLVGQYRTLGPSIENAEARKRGDVLAEMPPDKVDWNDVYELETLIIKLEPIEQLRQHLWSLRKEFERVAPNDYAAYEKSNSPEPAPVPPPPPPPLQTQAIDKPQPQPQSPPKSQSEKMRAEAVRIQEELNWYYTVLWVQETFRSNLLARVTRKTFKLVSGYALLGLALVMISGFVGMNKEEQSGVGHGGGGKNDPASNTNGMGKGSNVMAGTIGTNAPDANANTNGQSATMKTPEMKTSATRTTSEAKTPDTKMSFWESFTAGLSVWGTYFVVVFAGTIGALISVLRRIQRMTLDGNPDTNLVELEQNSSSIDLSPLLGAVFALLLLFMFMSGLLSGTLFPELPKGHSNIFLGCVPSECAQLAKLIVWSFIAGFAEKFVPDALDKLQSRATSTDKTTAPAK
jgi:hypothetical protein